MCLASCLFARLHTGVVTAVFDCLGCVPVAKALASSGLIVTQQYRAWSSAAQCQVRTLRGGALCGKECLTVCTATFPAALGCAQSGQRELTQRLATPFKPIRAGIANFDASASLTAAPRVTDFSLMAGARPGPLAFSHISRHVLALNQSP